MSDLRTFITDLSEVNEILLIGSDEWLPVRSIEDGYWKMTSGTERSKGGPGRRGWIITTRDGETVWTTSASIAGVR